MMIESHVWHDYEPFYRRDVQWSWIDFTFLKLAIERTYYVERFEFHIGVLGFHANIDLLWGAMEADRKLPKGGNDSE